ncbi:hypothetical protein A6R68_11238, partial [Neotoma lepida]
GFSVCGVNGMREALVGLDQGVLQQMRQAMQTRLVPRPNPQRPSRYTISCCTKRGQQPGEYQEDEWECSPPPEKQHITAHCQPQPHSLMILLGIKAELLFRVIPVILMAKHLFFLPGMLPILTPSLQLLQTVQKRDFCNREDTEFEPTRTEGKLVCWLTLIHKMLKNA